MAISLAGETAARRFMLLFLVLNLPFYFIDAYLPAALHRMIVLGVLAFAVLALRRLAVHPAVLLLLAFFLFVNVAKLFLTELRLQDVLWFTGLPVVVGMAVLMCLGRESLCDVFGSLSWIVIALTIPAMIVWLALVTGVNLPYSMMSLSGRGDLYRNYAGLAIFTDYTIFNVGGLSIARLGGMFEEPGMLGTIVGVLFTTDVVLFSGRHAARRVLLATIGILTFSLAFFIMFVPVVIYLAASRAHLLRTIAIAGLVLAGVLTTDTVVGKAAQIFFVSRLQVNDDGSLSGDTRSAYAEIFARYLSEASPTRLLLGNGPGSNSLNPEAQFASSHALVYEYGVLGTVAIAVFVAYFALIPLVRWHSPLAFMAVLGPILSLYQRPDVTGPHYLLLFALLFAHQQRVVTAATGPARPRQGGLSPVGA